MMGNPEDINRVKRVGCCVWLVREDGFTLLELITSLVLLGLLAAVFGMGIVAAVKSDAFSRANVQVAQKGQLAMARIDREIRELTSIVAISDTSAADPYIIYQRLPEGNMQQEQLYAIHFYPNDHILRLYSSTNLTDPLDHQKGNILVDRVSNFSLSYYSGSGDYSGSGNWIWGNNPLFLSTIKVTLQLERQDNPAVTQDFETVVHLRNSENYGGAAYTTNPPIRSDYSCFISTIGGI